MIRATRFLSLSLAALMVLGSFGPARAAEAAADAVYCFQAEDFPCNSPEDLTGICITAVPAANMGTLQLNSRIIVPGDILTAQQLSRLTFHPVGEESQDVQVSYLPICSTCVEQEATMTLSLRKQENKAPTAEDSTFETYKNLENQGTLLAKDPEGGSLQFTITKPPKHGTVTLGDNGAFTYAPTKNRVGEDRFSFTATDEQGAVSPEASVSIQILKPLDSTTYKDITSGQFEALWMRESGLFEGKLIAGVPCFGPQDRVSRSEFLAMVMKLLEIPVDESVTSSGFQDEADCVQWLRPYLAAAMRLGVVSGSKETGKLLFRPNDPITSAEAAVMLQNVLLLPRGTETCEDVPTWAQNAVAAMTAGGISLSAPDSDLSRLEAAKLLYEVSKLAPNAPGLEVFRKDS